MSIRIEVRAFGGLTVHELYGVLALRSRVFVVEQACAYQDADGRDLDALHVIALRGEEVVGCARILPPGSWRFEEPAIGRVVVAPDARGRGLARALMERAIEVAEEHHGELALALAAQAHLEGFYGSLGFVRSGVPYEEDGILHIDMRRGSPERDR